jgi:hypothetical protein
MIGIGPSVHTPEGSFKGELHRVRFAHQFWTTRERRGLLSAGPALTINEQRKNCVVLAWEVIECRLHLGILQMLSETGVEFLPRSQIITIRVLISINGSWEKVGFVKIFGVHRTVIPRNG